MSTQPEQPYGVPARPAAPADGGQVRPSIPPSGTGHGAHGARPGAEQRAAFELAPDAGRQQVPAAPSAAPSPTPVQATEGGLATVNHAMGLPGTPSGESYPAPTGSLPSRSELEREAKRSAAADSHESAPEADLERAGELVARVTKTFSQRVVGQQQLRVALVSTLIAGGHILLESVPGLAKTTAAQTLASAASGSFHRIQCTPDLMPNDIIGTQVLNYSTGELTTQLGPVHANIVLLDEINRSSAKTQSAMLEAMQERQTSIGGVVYPLPKPFMVLATQNPIEEEGTYVLPEAQMDRFLMKEVLTYPKPAEEADVLDRISKGTFGKPITTPPISTDDVLWLQGAVERVYVDPVIKQYIVALVNTSRGGGPRPVAGLERHVRVGASPRGGIALMKVAQAIALQAGRTYVTPDDVGLLRHAVLRHRLVLTYDALADDVAPESIIDAIFAAVPTP